MNAYIRYFLIFALLALVGGVVFGTLAAFQFLYPGMLEFIPFYKLRPLHVSLVVAWIFLASTGCIFYFVSEFKNAKRFSLPLTAAYLTLFVSGGLLILVSFIYGKFGGREYWEAHPVFSLVVLLAWLVFMINFFKTAFSIRSTWPVYLWMWATGVTFFLVTFIEAHAWLLPSFNNNVVRDITVQWKAYGALVGSWNMLVYGIAVFLVEKITGNIQTAKSGLSFSMYFLGFFNLLFGWAHHIYIVPCSPVIRVISYAVSMTELIILFKIIYNARQSVINARPYMRHTIFAFLLSSDLWVLLNLTLALLISIPAVNLYTHGTHVTVAHAMGSTIGINTFILFSALAYVTSRLTKIAAFTRAFKLMRSGIWILNISLLAFWLFLIAAGFRKGYLIIENNISHHEAMSAIENYLLGFSISGIGILAGILLIAAPLFIHLLTTVKTDENQDVL